MDNVQMIWKNKTCSNQPRTPTHYSTVTHPGISMLSISQTCRRVNHYRSKTSPWSQIITSETIGPIGAGLGLISESFPHFCSWFQLRTNQGQPVSTCNQSHRKLVHPWHPHTCSLQSVHIWSLTFSNIELSCPSAPLESLPDTRMGLTPCKVWNK